MLKILLQGDSYTAKGDSARILREVLNEKGEGNITITCDTFYKAIPVIINEYKETLQEYTVINNEEVKIKEGSPGNWSDYLDILVNNQEITRIGSVLLENSYTLNITVASVSTVDKEASIYTFADNELFTNLAQLIHQQNIKEIIYTDSAFTKVFTALGIIHYKIAKKSSSSVLDLLEAHLNINTANYVVKNESLVNTLRMDDKAAESLLGGEIKIEDEINCSTPQGKRLLQMFLRSPTTEVEEIERRQSIITEILQNTHNIFQFRKVIKSAPDVYTICKKQAPTISIQSAVKLHKFILSISHISSSLQDIRSLAHEVQIMQDALAYTQSLKEEIEEIVDMSTQEIKETSSEKLKILSGLLRQQEQELFAEYTEEIKKSSLEKAKPKLENTSMHGYCIRIPRIEEGRLTSQIKIAVQKSGVLFTTESIKRINHKIQSTKRDIHVEHSVVLRMLADSFMLYRGWLEIMNHTVATCDVFCSLADYANSNEFVCPMFSKDGKYKISNMMHPLLPVLYRRKMLQNIKHVQEPVRNSLEISREKRVCIITGANMGGKTTFLKSVGVVSILAQIGSYVPADYAHIPIFTQIFIRMGASDNAEKGMSTFMAEMVDVSNILNQATEHSLVIIDELGRGTSDEDGFAIAAATVEHLIRINAVTLFATHFHELADTPGVENKKVGGIAKNNRVVMTYKMEDGKADSSHGINTAQVMGFPKEVISRAEEALKESAKENNKE
ncbi:DNA mismatch repair protein MSH2 [Nematocida minor]|uniref:DNA mismatch repair protein MSH2 n=1 Tax=Nematocida minor TaxID=1912983 RepID=UPI00221FAB33|nr:DNA mismatch repair protein MSH2 [Nematocida minor]KAI5191528.1 DNA mismatch repair protein MSH2 [Nematocida minor]